MLGVLAWYTKGLQIGIWHHPLVSKQKPKTCVMRQLRAHDIDNAVKVITNSLVGSGHHNWQHCIWTSRCSKMSCLFLHHGARHSKPDEDLVAHVKTILSNSSLVGALTRVWKSVKCHAYFYTMVHGLLKPNEDLLAHVMTILSNLSLVGALIGVWKGVKCHAYFYTTVHGIRKPDETCLHRSWKSSQFIYIYIYIYFNLAPIFRRLVPPLLQSEKSEHVMKFQRKVMILMMIVN
jgi:hypothetical protein